MNRFTEIQPQLVDTGLEPCLLEILEDYYDLIGLNSPGLAAAEYVRKWLELEKSQCEAIPAENANAV